MMRRNLMREASILSLWTVLIYDCSTMSRSKAVVADLCIPQRMKDSDFDLFKPPSGDGSSRSLA